jgi:methionyl-tRNA formyltransferase
LFLNISRVSGILGIRNQILTPVAYFDGRCSTGSLMFDTMILLTGAVEHPVFASVLCRHNPRLTIVPILTSDDLAAIGPGTLQRARLIAFTTPVIVPQNVLDQLGYGGYNFHPGPPQYPGWAPAHFALYDQATEFGATLHVMVRQVDAGPIVDVEHFTIPQAVSVAGLEELAYMHLARMFWRSAALLATSVEPLPPLSIQWSGKRNSRRGYRAICDIPVDIRKDELERRIRVFGANHFGIAPTIHLHGVKFRAVVPDQDQVEA